MFLESGLVGGIVGNVDLDLQFHGTFIVPLQIKM
jgi:GH25 family lysozyme M1 (1,4-beta-N-acetylmuramidase)